MCGVQDIRSLFCDVVFFSHCMCVGVGDVSSLFCDEGVALVVCVCQDVSSLFCDVSVAPYVCVYGVGMLVHCFVM